MVIGFLSPCGEFISCDELQHSKIAEEILLNLKKINIINPEVELANLGWCFFQKNFAGIPADCKPYPKLTDEQIQWIISNYDSLNRKQHYFISEKLKLDETSSYRSLPDGIDNVPFTGLV